MKKNIVLMIIAYSILAIIPYVVHAYVRMLTGKRYELSNYVYPTFIREENLKKYANKKVKIKSCNLSSRNGKDEIGVYDNYCFDYEGEQVKIKFYLAINDKPNMVAYEIDGEVHYVDVCVEGCNE